MKKKTFDDKDVSFFIGTDATHADHIETIKSRMYVGVKPDGKFVPGELGMGLVEGKVPSKTCLNQTLSKPDPVKPV